MIYVSTSCVRSETIRESVIKLADAGYRNLELSGGTSLYHGFVDELLELKDAYGLNYFLHNYFPPPEQHFILNLASLNDDLNACCIDHCKRAIDLCAKLGSGRYAVHAGFLIDFSPQEAGKKISHRRLNDRKAALSRFCEAWRILQDEAGDSVALYIENNVLSQTNADTYGNENPFLLTDCAGYSELQQLIDYNLLLDLAHLKVSSHSLHLDFQEEAGKLMSTTNYLHVSGNDGLHDQNHGVTGDPDITAVLENSDLSDKTITLEVYDGLDSIADSFKYLEGLGA